MSCLEPTCVRHDPVIVHVAYLEYERQGLLAAIGQVFFLTQDTGLAVIS